MLSIPLVESCYMNLLSEFKIEQYGDGQKEAGSTTGWSGQREKNGDICISVNNKNKVEKKRKKKKIIQDP